MYFRPKVIYPDPKEPRENSILRYIGYRVLRNNKNFLCLSGDTKLYGQDKTLEELYSSGNIFVDTLSLTKFKSKPGTYYPVKSKSQIFYTGEKEVFEIELDNGKKGYATAEHKFFRNKKHSFEEAEVKDLKVGDKLRDYDINYLKKFYSNANDRSRKVLDKKYDPRKICPRCNGLFYVNRYSGCKTKKYCNSCSKEFINGKRELKKERDDVWYEWEDNLLRNFYYSQDKKFILSLMPHRTWSAIQHRAGRKQIIRNPIMCCNNAFTSEKNPMKNLVSKEKARKSLKKLYLEHPEALLNSRLKRNKMTQIEKKIANLLDELNIKYEWNKHIKTKTTWRFPDFKVGNLVIECDGIYWHKNNIEKDKLRQKELEDLGLEVIRFNDQEILKNFEEVKRCIAQKLNQ